MLLKLVASLMAQMVNNLLAMQKTWIRTLGQEDSLEKGMATHSNSLAWESWGQRNLAGTLKSLRSQRVNQIQLSCFHFFFSLSEAGTFWAMIGKATGYFYLYIKGKKLFWQLHKVLQCKSEFTS